MTESVRIILPLPQRLISVLWPSFVTAIIASGAFFSAFQPQDLLPFDLDHEVSPLAAYSIGFFIFWFISILSSMGTLYFAIANGRVAANSRE